MTFDSLPGNVSSDIAWYVIPKDALLRQWERAGEVSAQVQALEISCPRRALKRFVVRHQRGQ